MATSINPYTDFGFKKLFGKEANTEVLIEQQLDYEKQQIDPSTPFPILTTTRLTLRPLLLSDAKDVFTLRSDSAINKYLDRQPSKTIDDAISFINNITENIKKNESIYWAITLTESNTFVGTICLFGFSDQEHKCEIGYELLSHFQGKGLMHEAASKVIEYAVKTMNVQTIEAFTHQNNQPSIRLLEQLEFKKSIEPDKTNPDCYVFTFGSLNI
jgi:ribosomal-protein-alanine N-acetyltransferase